ncbi:MAG: FkbM family methyltransferase [Vicinamibacterales bacterium]
MRASQPVSPHLPTVLFPAGLAAGEHYMVLCAPDDGVAAAVVDLLAWASPGAQCVGVRTAPMERVTTVLFGPDALERGGRLLRCGAVSGPVRYMPLPVGYPWAFWETWLLFGDRRDLWHCLPAFEAYRHYFTRSPYLGGVQNAHITRWDGLRDSPLYWTESRALLDAHAAELARVRAGLADDLSRTTLDMVLASEPRQLWHHYLSTIFATTDYLDDDVPRPGEHVMNLGVFTGHELPYFSSLMGDTGVVHCIDPVGLDLLSEYARAHVAASRTRMVESRFAASATAGTANFRRYPDGQVCLNSTAEWDTREFPTATVDDYVRAVSAGPVGFIKIDIEGMELEALAGMHETIATHRPTISLAIYHEPDHLWRIPLHLMATLRDYRFHLSHTSPVRWETVLTAVPVERAGGGIRSRQAA